MVGRRLLGILMVVLVVAVTAAVLLLPVPTQAITPMAPTAVYHKTTLLAAWEPRRMFQAGTVHTDRAAAAALIMERAMLQQMVARVARALIGIVRMGLVVGVVVVLAMAHRSVPTAGRAVCTAVVAADLATLAVRAERAEQV